MSVTNQDKEMSRLSTISSSDHTNIWDEEISFIFSRVAYDDTNVNHYIDTIHCIIDSRFKILLTRLRHSVQHEHTVIIT